MKKNCFFPDEEDGDGYEEEDTTWDSAPEENQRKKLEPEDVPLRDSVDHFHRLRLLPRFSKTQQHSEERSTPRAKH